MEKFFEKRKELVAKFIKSYLIQKELEKTPGFDENEDMGTSEDVKLAACNPFDTELEAGQIRLLSNTKRITYVALLRRWEDNSFVVMPFSPYDVPATDEEFTTEYDGGLFQRVLQVWNTRTLQDETLRKTWLISSLSERDIEDAWHLWEASLGGKDVEDRLLEKTALPIYRSNDPRLEYKSQELENLSKLDEEDLAWLEEQRPMFRIALGGFAAQQADAMAAGAARENPQFTLCVEGKDMECIVEYSWHDKSLSFDVYDTSKGEKSHEFDGFQLYDFTNGNFLGTVQKGTLHVKNYDLTPNSEIELLDKDGNEICSEIYWKR